MRILTIKGENLASLREAFTIDFRTEPLCSAGIFAITGKTGAGKSTILDALCLALYDKTPRTGKASEDVQVADVSDKTISQRDCRNILRRGASDGYAEVDFEALDGKEYRATWSVRRARNRADGAMQNSAIRLLNLTDDSEEQGGKKELLSRIVQLLGLTFDQFTRAVLLAQGDFATFLKARQADKAELLEKLTGTEVYSRLSMSIYRKAEAAKQDLLLVRQRIEDVQLLSEDELETLQQQKLSLTEQRIDDEKALKQIEAHLQWLKQYDEIELSYLQSQEAIKLNKEALLLAKDRFEYMERYDLVAEIRDCYRTVKQTENAICELQQKQVDSVLRKTALVVEIERQQKLFDETKQQRTELQKTLVDIRPEIERAKQLDVLLQASEKNRDAIEKERLQLQTRCEQLQADLEMSNRQLAQNRLQQADICAWFEQKKGYEDTIAKSDLIINLLDEAQLAKKQETDLRASLADTDTLLKTYHIRFERLLTELDEVNRILPAEVLSLRAKLEASQPCPVCGSLHHPYSELPEQSRELKEQELTAEIKGINENLTKLNDSIETTTKEKSKMEALLQNFCDQYVKTVARLETLLPLNDELREQMSSGVLQTKISVFAAKWNATKDKLSQLETELGKLTTQSEMGQKALVQARDDAKLKETELRRIAKIAEEEMAERQRLLSGRVVEEVEQEFDQRQQQLQKNLEDCQSELQKLLHRKSEMEGVAIKLIEDLKTQNNLLAENNRQLVAWLDKHSEKGITSSVLDELVSKPATWIANEKKALTALREKEVALSAQLLERKDQLNRHILLGFEVLKDEERKKLIESSIDRQNGIKKLQTELLQLESRLLAHQKAKEQLGGLQTELEQKESVYNDWGKLNELFGSASGNKFKTIAQGYTLDVLLGYANKHLKQLTGRYEISKIPGSLALQVTDNDMLGEVRTVHSLSGGESFLVSLSLALGLSSLSSNKMSIESLFIDEGFGSLDVDTLSVAMDALENLRTQGRKIGVISHVTEMTERITTQIRVVALSNGQSKVQIIG